MTDRAMTMRGPIVVDLLGILWPIQLQQCSVTYNRYILAVLVGNQNTGRSMTSLFLPLSLCQYVKKPF